MSDSLIIKILGLVLIICALAMVIDCFRHGTSTGLEALATGAFGALAGVLKSGSEPKP